MGGDGDGLEAAVEVLRNGLHVKWRRNLLTERLAWLQPHAGNDSVEAKTNRVAIVDCLPRLTYSDWWTWKAVAASERLVMA